jgi:acetyl esterase
MLSVFGAMVVVAVLFPAIPVLGVVGSLIGDQRGGQLAIAGALGVLAAYALHVLGRRILRFVLAISAVVTLAGAVVITSTQITFAHSVGADVTVADVFAVGSSIAPADETVTVGSPDGVALKASVWRTKSTTSTRSAVLWVHGGGFNEGSRNEQSSMARTLADHGYPVVSVSYRLEAKQPWRAETGDVICGLSWMQSHARQLHIDPSDITIIGGSAGGSLALNVAYGLREGTVDSSCGGTLPRPPRAVAAFYPAADLLGVYYDNGLMPVSDYAHQVLKTYLRGLPSRVPNRLRYADPASKVAPHLQPTLIVNGENDRLIRASRNERFATRLRRDGNDVTFHAVPFSDHGYDLNSNTIGAAASRAMILSFLRDRG